ncbi:MAG: AI-2E family transporter [Microbacterium sp.]
MAESSEPLADTDPAVPASARTRERHGILTLVDRPLVVAFIATLGVLGGLIIGSALASITTILIYIVLALFISLGLDPIVRMLERRGVKRGSGILIVFGVFALLAAAFFIFVLPPIIAQIVEFLQNFPEALVSAKESEWFLALAPDYQDAVGAALDELAVALAKPETIAAIGGGALAVGVGLVSAISAGFIIVALTLYFLASLTGMKQALYALAPAHNRPRLSDMTERVTVSIGRSLLGSVTLAAINSAVVLVLHLVIGLPYAGLMALIAFVITLIPLFGSVIFWVFATLAALFSSPTQALIFGIAYLIYIQLESYIVTPRVMTKAVAIPAALVLIGAMVGGTLAGVIGVLVALPVMATGLLIIREVVVPKQDLKV